MAELRYLAGYPPHLLEAVNALLAQRRLHASLAQRYPDAHAVRNDGALLEYVAAFLRMIVVHELAHLRERDHGKAFYALCQHMESNYHQLEFDTRLWLTALELEGPHPPDPA